MSTKPCLPHESPTYSSAANHLKFDIKLAPSVSRASIRLSFKQQANRIVIPRKDPILPMQLVGARSGRRCRAAIQSANVSRQKIEIEEEGVQVKLQFSKEQTNRLKNAHKRTKSNHVELCEIKEDQLSNFSNSLQNISQEIIEIPFAKQIITPTPFHKNQPESGKFRKAGSVEHSNGSSLQKRVLSPSLKLAFQRKSTQKCRNKQNEQVHSRTQSKPLKQMAIPRPKHKQAVSLFITDFNLKAIKITEGGSIIYLASHKRTNFLVAIKCLKKRALRQNIQAFIVQLKLGLLLNSPNIAKIYGFFADSDNIYIIKEYLEEGCILERRKKMGQNEIGCEINQVLNGVIAVLPHIGCQWRLQPKNIAQTHSISKITSIKVNPRGSEEQFSERLKHCLSLMLESERKSDLVKDMFETNQSIHLNMLRHGSYLLCSFREMLQSMLILTASQILMLWQAHFLKQFRFKALMEEG